MDISPTTTLTSTSLFPVNNDLQVVFESSKEYNMQTWLDALLDDNLCDSLAKVKQLALNINIGLAFVQKDYERLYRFSLTFNEDYATYYNDCFKLAAEILRKLRSTMKRHRECFEKVAPKHRHMKKYAYLGIEKPKNLTNYKFGQATKTLFGIEAYPEEVKYLYEQVNQFFAILAQSMCLCINMLNDEDRIRQDRVESSRLYENQKRKLIAELGNVIMDISIDDPKYSPQHNPLIAARMQCKDDLAFIQEHFHRLTPDELRPLMIREEKEKLMRHNLTPFENELFGGDPEKVKQAKYLVSQLPKLLSEDYGRKKIDARCVAAMYRYVMQPNSKQPKRNKKDFYAFFVEEYKKHNFSYELFSENAFYNQYKAMTNEDYRPYRERMDEILAQNNLQKSA